MGGSYNDAITAAFHDSTTSRITGEHIPYRNVSVPDDLKWGVVFIIRNATSANTTVHGEIWNATATSDGIRVDAYYTGRPSKQLHIHTAKATNTTLYLFITHNRSSSGQPSRKYTHDGWLFNTTTITKVHIDRATIKEHSNIPLSHFLHSPDTLWRALNNPSVILNDYTTTDQWNLTVNVSG